MNKIYYYLAGFLVLSGGLGAMEDSAPAKKVTFAAVLERMKTKEKYVPVVKQVPANIFWHDGIKDVRRFVLEKRHFLYPQGE